MDSGPYTVDVDTGEISGPGLNAFTNENPRDWASRLNAAYAAGVAARAKAADAVVEALRRIMADDKECMETGLSSLRRDERINIAAAALRAAGE